MFACYLQTASSCRYVTQPRVEETSKRRTGRPLKREMGTDQPARKIDSPAAKFRKKQWGAQRAIHPRKILDHCAISQFHFHPYFESVGRRTQSCWPFPVLCFFPCCFWTLEPEGAKDFEGCDGQSNCQNTWRRQVCGGPDCQSCGHEARLTLAWLISSSQTCSKQTEITDLKKSYELNILYLNFLASCEGDFHVTARGGKAWLAVIGSGTTG